jgi:hypothetical protein
MWTGITLRETIDAQATATRWGLDDVLFIIVMVVHLKFRNTEPTRFLDFAKVVVSRKDRGLLMTTKLTRVGADSERTVNFQ